MATPPSPLGGHPGEVAGRPLDEHQATRRSAARGLGAERPAVDGDADELGHLLADGGRRRRRRSQGSSVVVVGTGGQGA